jgi:hypothetical protein
LIGEPIKLTGKRALRKALACALCDEAVVLVEDHVAAVVLLQQLPVT